MSVADDRQRALARLLDELQRDGVTDVRVLAALAAVPRERFVPPEHRGQAFLNAPLPIGGGQTISQPLVVGLMTQALAPQPHERILEVGTGSGYQLAILAQLAGCVVSVERLPELAQRARLLLHALGVANVEIHVSNGSLGWPAGAPYDGIIVTAAAPAVPDALVHQVRPGGKIVVPVGSRGAQQLILAVRHDDEVERRDLGPVRFVPLLGEGGWSESDFDRYA